MVADLALHWLLDMSGAASLACIYGACKDPDHNHPSWMVWVGENPWKVQSAVALFVAYVTIKLVG